MLLHTTLFSVGLPDLPYFTGARIFQPASFLLEGSHWGDQISLI